MLPFSLSAGIGVNKISIVNSEACKACFPEDENKVLPIETAKSYIKSLAFQVIGTWRAADIRVMQFVAISGMNYKGLACKRASMLQFIHCVKID